MPPCPTCQQPACKRNGRDRRSRQKYACWSCRRTFTENTVSTFSGYRWLVDVILTAVRWYMAYPLSSRQVVELLAERGIDVSHRTVLNWVQTFGPQLASKCDGGVGRLVGVGWSTRCSCSARTTSTICTEQSTRTAWLSMSCYVSTATRRVPRPSFTRRSSAPE